MSVASTTDSVQVLRLKNTTGQEQELWIEPLGDRVALTPNVTYELTATNALEEIDLSTEGCTVHGWVTRVSALDDKGNKQTVWELPG